jgi:hypothetical protein
MWHLVQISCLAMSLAGLFGCASNRSSESTADVTLDIIDYKEGDRSAMIEVHNHSKGILAYDGPYVEQQAATGWTEYKSNEPEMAVLNRARRVGPTLTDAWWVRLPSGPCHWRAYVRCRWSPKEKSAEPSPEFKVWSPERHAPAMPQQ